MHSIERYGIVALLFLVVTVVAVLMWDGNRNGEGGKSVQAGAPAFVARASTGQISAAPVSAVRVADGSSRLSLRLEGKPGPLLRPALEDLAARRDEYWADASEGEAVRPEVMAQEERFTDDAQRPAGRALEPQPVQEGRSGAAPSEPAPAAQRSAGRDYLVRSGDTLSEIAQRELGSARLWPEIVAANNGLDPAKLRSGRTIRLPGVSGQAPPGAGSSAAGSAPARKTSVVSSGKTWKVRKGENLWRIAERALGDGKRWQEIVAVNPGMNPDRILLGQVLQLPAGADATIAKEPAPRRERAGSGLVASAERSPRGGSKVR